LVIHHLLSGGESRGGLFLRDVSTLRGVRWYVLGYLVDLLLVLKIEVSDLRVVGLVEGKIVENVLEYTATPCICGLHKH